MKIHQISEDELDYVCAVCLDPSVGKKTREMMEGGMNDRLCWIKNQMKNGLEILIVVEKPRKEKIRYKWAGLITHAELAVHGLVPKGLLEFLPIEYALEPIEGESMLFINCIWILPPFWNSGVAKSLIESFVERAKEYGGASVLAYEGDRWFGTTIKYMPFRFFEKFGFKEIATDGTRKLLYLDLGANDPPTLVLPETKPVENSNRTQLDIFFNSQCPWNRYMIEEVKQNIQRYPEICVNLVNTDDREKILEYGVSRGIFLNGEPVIKRMAEWNEIKSEIDKIKLAKK
ncbi:MAG: GNAT family N-acetyltransferase [Candidatus Heimdallarchaeota archaeon]|nr:MAG: GNAT family N-acetyltransferase [Candidatus Heimdallarchaeota archaeon]